MAGSEAPALRKPPANRHPHPPTATAPVADSTSCDPSLCCVSEEEAGPTKARFEGPFLWTTNRLEPFTTHAIIIISIGGLACFRQTLTNTFSIAWITFIVVKIFGCAVFCLRARRRKADSP